MQIRTFFCENKVENSFVITGEELNHLNVLRLKIGDEVNIVANLPQMFLCKIISISKQNAICEIIKITECNANSNSNLTAFVCIEKQDKNEFVAEKLTELGVNKIVFVESKFVARQGKLNVERIKKIIISATKQCGRSVLPTVEQCSIKQIEVKSFDEFVVAYECENKNKFPKKFVGKNIAFLVGSEGGFAEEEIAFLKNKGAKIFSLGKRILRAETACIVVATLCQNALEELN